MISTHTIVSLALLVLSLAATWAAGLISTTHLATLTLESCVLIGLFASVAAVLVMQLWRVQSVSGGGRLQLPAPLRAAVYISIFCCIGLAAFDNRRTALLMDLGDQTSVSLSRYCKQSKRAVAKPVLPTQVRKVRGCALILRAYRLGYTKKLGQCAPKKVAAQQRAAASNVGDGPCQDRQHDEPLLHYAWRVLTERSDEAATLDPVGSVKNSLREFDTKLGYVSTLLDNQRLAITAAPHAAHHIWVNLPKPRSESVISRYFMPSKDCSTRYMDMKTTMRWSSEATATSALVEHAIGRLLFDPRLGTPVGYCREYTIHWNAPVDACTRIATNTARFLSRSGALDSVHAVLQRHRAKTSLRELATDLGKKAPSEALADPRRLVSFQCLIADDQGTGKLRRSEATVSGVTLAVHELRGKGFSPRGADQLSAYTRLALLLGGVSYNGPVDQTSVAALATRPTASGDVTAQHFALTRLDMLRQTDPFIAGASAMDHNYLVDVFPLRFHLQNLVDVFRRTYRRQRGRL